MVLLCSPAWLESHGPTGVWAIALFSCGAALLCPGCARGGRLGREIGERVFLFARGRKPGKLPPSAQVTLYSLAPGSETPGSGGAQPLPFSYWSREVSAFFPKAASETVSIFYSSEDISLS